MKQFLFNFKTDDNMIDNVTFSASGMFDAMKQAQTHKRALAEKNPGTMITVEFIGIAYSNIA
ncbi:hypothetical protein [Bacillus sp. PS06]|uniref:hypothetical protein n=1 Tax=Bacillus sp. PS06 TaxID=2764176 RepID=UPI0017823C12|nr:hypothetical protein [Bacillus sp. PS06]MBD8068599.1 hypothetical protein [Bacillus sp. PS06]